MSSAAANLALAALLAALAACGSGESGNELASSPPPAFPPATPNGKNVLLIITEDHGAQAGIFGTPGAVTPNIDALAAAGTMYTRAYVTVASCSPSKAALFTGRHNHANGVKENVQEFVGSAEALAAANPRFLSDPNSFYNRNRVRDAVPTLVEMLRFYGYYTGTQNKFHLSPHGKFPYDHWRPEEPDSYAEVSQFIEEARQAGKPWFLVHHVNRSHRPYPDGDAGPLPVDPATVSVPAHLPDTATVRQDWSEYLSAVGIADRRVGDALRALENSGETGETLVVLIGDHGPSYHRAKWTTYELGLRVPLVFRGLDVTPARVSADLFSGVDLMPTLLGFLDLPAPATLDGVSHRERLAGRDSNVPRSIVVGEASSDRSIFDGTFRLVFMPVARDTVMPADNRDFDPWRNRVYEHILANASVPGFAAAYRFLDLADAALPVYDRPQFELFETASDPWEVRDFAPDPTRVPELTRLKALLSAWQASTGDPGPAP